MSVLRRAWARLHGRRYGDYIWTASGERFYPLDPRPEDIRICDIARGLSTECRYGGQIGMTSGHDFYSVAEHCVIVSCAVGRETAALGLGYRRVRDWSLQALLHDASEAYIGDISRPLKYTCEMRPFLAIESRLEHAIERAFSLLPCRGSRALIKTIDNRVLVDEMTEMMTLPIDEDIDRQIALHGPALGAVVRGLSPARAERLFLNRFEELNIWH